MRVPTRKFVPKFRSVILAHSSESIRTYNLRRPVGSVSYVLIDDALDEEERLGR